MVMRYWREMAPTINVNVFAYEYTGYGLSRGPPTPSEDHLYSDVEAAFKYLRDVIGVPWERTVVFGRSLGSGPSVHLASITAVRGLILQSPVLSIFRVGLRFRYTLPGDSFLNIDKMEYVRCPVYVVHGTDDEIVPLWHGKALYELAKHSVTPFWVEGGGHNNLEILAYDQFLFRLKNFLHQLETLPLDVGDIQSVQSPMLPADATQQHSQLAYPSTKAKTTRQQHHPSTFVFFSFIGPQ
ncbi:hypothetical protein FOZ60_009818 [Perkinsus olseni]|uniref:Uncharacterized protein n=1 Tax=Perkinsus olseni TaxID=32597 RepID=A0A7J6NGE2_PEROL|nr:hypothetical protein FOZ60_009818 [Perkinsus olseni]